MRPLFALAAVLGLTVACSSPTGPSLTPSVPLQGALPAPALTRGVLRATVDGIPSEAASPVASVSSGLVGSTPVATIVGRFEQLETLLSVTVPLVVGSYELGGAAHLDFALYQGPAFNPTAFWIVNPFTPGSSGAVTVTAASATRVAGTFAFTAVSPGTRVVPETRIVTSGVFDLSR